MNTLPDFWFSLGNHTYISFEGDNSVLLYNVNNGERFESSDSLVIDLMRDLYTEENLGVVLLKGSEIQNNSSLNTLFKAIQEKSIGRITEVENFQHRPMSLLPMLNLQRDVDKMKDKGGISVGQDISHYLLELNLYLNDFCQQTCAYCDGYKHQVKCCMKSNQNQAMPVELLEKIATQIRSNEGLTINILGGDILSYSTLDRVPALFETHSQNVSYWLNYRNYNKENWPQFITNLELIVSSPFDLSICTAILHDLSHINSKFNFIVENEGQLETVYSFVEQSGIDNYTIAPFYTGDNYPFFEENIFMSVEDIFNSPIEMRKIFCNQKLNSNNFGSIYVFPDGRVRANTNARELGDLNYDSILHIVEKEMIENTAWRQIRDQEPCANCLYQYLCPPCSNYERAIGKINLCHLK